MELHVAMLEVHNENVFDLLDPNRPKLQVRQGPDGVYCDGLLTRPVDSAQAIESIIAQGEKNRTTAAT